MDEIFGEFCFVCGDGVVDCLEGVVEFVDFLCGYGVYCVGVDNFVWCECCYCVVKLM